MVHFVIVRTLTVGLRDGIVGGDLETVDATLAPALLCLSTATIRVIFQYCSSLKILAKTILTLGRGASWIILDRIPYIESLTPIKIDRIVLLHLSPL